MLIVLSSMFYVLCSQVTIIVILGSIVTVLKSCTNFPQDGMNVFPEALVGNSAPSCGENSDGSEGIFFSVV